MKQEANAKRIGLLGGSFDPIHLGHLNIANQARVEYDLDEVWFIPAGHSPNKEEDKMTSAEIRTKMVALAVEDNPYFKVSRIEVEANETSYTYVTLSKLTRLYPNVQFYFIMGADSLDYFEQWCHPEIICQKASILVAVRDDMDVAQINKKISLLSQFFEAQIYLMQGGKTDISSTTLRKKICICKKRPDFLPEAVWNYICEHGLYDCKNRIDSETV